MTKRPRSGKDNPPSIMDDHNGMLPLQSPSTAAHLNDPSQVLEDVADRLTDAASKPEDFFQANEQLAQELTSVLRQLFTIARRSEAQKKPFGPLEELYVQGLDCESIWSELELRNAPLEKHTRKTLVRLLQSEDMSLAADIASEEEDENPDNEDSEGGDNDTDDDGGDADDGADDDSEQDVERGMEGDAHGRGAVEEVGAGGEGGDNSRKSRKQTDKEHQDDMFFNSDDMEKFADEGDMEGEMDDGVLDQMYGGGEGSDSEERGADSSNEEQNAEMAEDMISHDSEEGDERVGGGIKHSDFFDEDGPVRSKSRKGRDSLKAKTRHTTKADESDEEEEEDGSEDDEQEEEDEELTGHGAQSRRMQGKISDHEKELLAEKPWALRGEVHSHDRPQNSLLEAMVDVDRATRVAPPPTPEMAMSLLDMIKKRCLDGNWDDVTPRDLQGPTVRKEAPHLSQDKNKEGLGELYEKEFLKKTMGVTEDDPQVDLKNELKQLFTKLCGKLDALCNFHYTPKAAIPEMKVQADVAAIAMEEVLPSSVADADALAPEEVYAKKRGRDAEFLEGDGEMAQDDRKRARSSKKAVRRKARRKTEAAQKLVSKLNPGLGNKYEKAKMLRDIQGSKNVTTVTGDGESTGREFSTSAKFFSYMQENVKTSVKSAANGAEGDAKEGNDKRAAQLRL